jgi:DNA-binding NarL/FixJ family response regulator
MLRKELVDTIRAVHAGRRRIPPEVAAELAEHCVEDALTGREIDILTRVAQGNSNKIVASQLEISEATVKYHLKSILSNVGANDQTHAVTIARKRGFLEG